jgi:hypothetical protein
MNHQPLTLIISPQPRLKRSRRVKASHGFFAQKNSQFFIGAFMRNRLEIAQKTPKKPCKFAPKTMPIMIGFQFINQSQSVFGLRTQRLALLLTFACISPIRPVPSHPLPRRLVRHSFSGGESPKGDGGSPSEDGSSFAFKNGGRLADGAAIASRLLSALIP